jgi:5-methylcytosine-specific restriction endonuclease McrA
MPIPKPCLKCGRLTDGGSRCADHPTRWRSGSTREWRKTRARILARDGYRCTHSHRGIRCTATTLLEVHHVDGAGEVLHVPDSELATVCRMHHRRGR